jgi:hypothetical protein
MLRATTLAAAVYPGNTLPREDRERLRVLFNMKAVGPRPTKLYLARLI